MSIAEVIAALTAPAPPRYYRSDEGGYLVSIGVGVGGTEITAGEYAGLKALIDARPTPPEGYDYRLGEDLQWQLCVLPETQELDAPLDPAEALELICGKSALTRTEAARYRTELKRAEAETKEQREA